MCNRCVEWGGKLWHRYGAGRGSYYERTDKSVRPKKTVRLHRAVWEAHNGPIPEGFQVHHIDHDMANNCISNLQLVEPGVHTRLHGVLASLSASERRSKRSYVVACGECGVDLHRRQSGAAFCKRCQYRRAERKRKRKRECLHCKRAFESRAGNYCSQRCVNLATHGGTRRILPQSGGAA